MVRNCLIYIYINLTGTPVHLYCGMTFKIEFMKKRRKQYRYQYQKILNHVLYLSFTDARLAVLCAGNEDRPVFRNSNLPLE
jgi:hypothetical protein